MNLLRKHANTLLIIAASLTYLHSIFYFDFFGDSLKMLSAGTSPANNTLDYWLHILLKPTNYSQYRPLLYIYFWLVGHILNAPAVFFHIISLFLFCISTSNLFKIISSISKNQKLSLIGIIIYIANPIHFAIIHEPSLGFKYYLPLTIIFMGLRKIIDANALTKQIVLHISMLSIISLMTHEGSFTFGAIFYLFSLYFHGFKKISFIFILPTLLYIVTRLLFFDLPNAGFMKVSFKEVHLALAFFFETIGKGKILSFDDSSFTFGFILILFGCSYSIFKLIKKRNPFPALVFISSLIIIAPFSLLINHYWSSRAVWISFLVPTIVVYLGLNLPHRKIVIVCLCTLYCIFYYPRFQQPHKSIDISLAKENFLNTLTQKFENIAKGSTIQLNLPRSRGFIKRCVVSYYLARNFSEHNFRYQYSNGNILTDIAVYKGAIFKMHSYNNYWEDHFGYRYNFSPPKSNNTVNVSKNHFETIY